MVWLTTMLLGEPAAHACDATKLTAARDAIAAAPNPDQARRRLIAAVAGACTFPARIAEALRQMPSATQPDSFKIELAAVRASPSEWTTACPAGSFALEKAAVTRGPERRDVMYDPCNLMRFRFATSDEFAVADGYVFLATLLARQLQEEGVEDRIATPILRTLAGVGAKPTVVATTDVWGAGRADASAAAATQWGQKDEAGWLALADGLLARCDELAARPPAERSKNRQVEFDVCSQAGRAASNAGATGEPHVRELGGQPITVGYWAAATLGNTDDMLVRNCRDEELKNTLGWYVTQIRKGAIPATR